MIIFCLFCLFCFYVLSPAFYIFLHLQFLIDNFPLVGNDMLFHICIVYTVCVGFGENLLHSGRVKWEIIVGGLDLHLLDLGS